MWPNCLGAMRKGGIRFSPPAGSGGGVEFRGMTEEEQEQEQEYSQHSMY